jgi:NAD(P)-dependent dehydrogenase (short-subunit alcohol dehydrogenase family)
MSQFDFKSTTTLVTGASSGLGVEFARQIAARGGDLVLVARTRERLDAIAEELRAKHLVEITTLPTDLSEPAGVGEVIQFAANQRIKVLVNNAGFGTYGNLAELDPAREHAEIMVNVAAPVDLAHALLPGCSRAAQAASSRSRPRSASSPARRPGASCLRCHESIRALIQRGFVGGDSRHRDSRPRLVPRPDRDRVPIRPG